MRASANDDAPCGKSTPANTTAWDAPVQTVKAAAAAAVEMAWRRLFMRTLPR
jgi:hypothetical protein